MKRRKIQRNTPNEHNIHGIKRKKHKAKKLRLAVKSVAKIPARDLKPVESSDSLFHTAITCSLKCLI